MKNFIKEFQVFIIKGSVVELAIGVVVGVAFNAVVNSLVKDIVLGLIANIFGQPDFSALAWGAVKWGSFLNNLLNLLIVGLSIFVVIKLVNRLTGSKFGEPTPVIEKK